MLLSFAPVSGTARRRGAIAGFGAAILWALLCVRWFDAGSAYRLGWLAATPAAALAVPCLALASWWCAERWSALRGSSAPQDTRTRVLLAVAAVVFRLPLLWPGAAAYTTADGALSGIVALHVRDGGAHDVFVPEVPYSGSLKSHLTACAARAIDPARAFALVSALFYAAFVAGLHRLAGLVAGPRVALAAALYAVFSPAFVTHYSLSNDGNYVEVLALGTWALALAVRWLHEEEQRPFLALVVGLLVGVGFWCHVLIVLHLVAIALVWTVMAPAAAARAAPSVLLGFAVGDAPGLMWNARNHWDSFRALLPGASPAAVGAGDPALAERLWYAISDHAPILLGYDPGNAWWADRILRVSSVAAVSVAIVALARATRDALATRDRGLALLLAFTAIDSVVSVVALRYVPDNPRYLLFAVAPLAILIARALQGGPGRALFAALVMVNAAASLAQARGERSLDVRWRGFVAGIEAAGVRYCTTDFYLATRINFLSEERVVCSSKLGPTRTEYFVDYRARVDAAPEVALVAASGAQGDKIGRRLEALGVRYTRTDLMRPLFSGLSRRVDPEELFPGQSFGVR